MQIRHAKYSGQKNGMPQVDRQRLAHLCGIFQSLKGSAYVYETSKEKIHLAKALAKVFLDSCTLGKLGQKSLRELQGMRKGSSDAAHALRNNRLYATGSNPPYILPSADSASQCLEVTGPGERLCSMWSWNLYEEDHGIQGQFASSCPNQQRAPYQTRGSLVFLPAARNAHQLKPASINLINYHRKLR